MPSVFDWRVDPLVFVDNIYDEGENKDDFISKVTHFFEGKLLEDNAISTLCSIPETPLHQLKSNQLVRFRCMVQQQYGKEYYMDSYSVKNKTGDSKKYTACFKEIPTVKPDEELVEHTESNESIMMERNLCYCISIPGQNDWVSEALGSQKSSPEGDAELRLDDRGGSSKRGLDEEESDCMDTEDLETSDHGTKRVRVTAATSAPPVTGSSAAAGQQHKFNFPLLNDKGIACLVMFYNDADESVHMNEVLEVVGVVHMQPGLDQPDGSDADMMDMRESARKQSSSMVPRLHTLYYRRLDHAHPLLPPSAPSLLPPVAREGRELLRRVIEEACLGDPLVGDYLICCLMGSIYSRQDTAALGQFPLNISGIKAELSSAGFVSRLYSLIQQLTTHSHFLPLAIEHLNSQVFVPTKDYTSNELVSGTLQLPQHILMMVDETAMAEGQLQQQGITNLGQLASVIRSQTCKYDFQFHNIELDTNINVLVMSEGKSLLPCCSEVVLCPDHLDVSAAFTRVQELLTPDALSALRSYIVSARLLNYNLTHNMQKVLQDEFVEARKTDRAALTAETFHMQLVMARLVSMSCGETELSESVWRSCKILESKRVQRITSLNRLQPTLGQMAL